MNCGKKLAELDWLSVVDVGMDVREGSEEIEMAVVH